MLVLSDPKSIEQKSMEIIEDSLPGLAKLPHGEREIVKRIVHTTGDVSIAGQVTIHPQAVEAGLKAIRNGRMIATDINMLKVGINSSRLRSFNIDAVCYISDPDVAREAKERRLTRAMVAMERAAREAIGGIIAIGNAPTALFTLCRLINNGEAAPALVVGTPVGFVGACESKETLVETAVPYITLPGTRGGSAIAVAAINALLALA
jgi:precorrin-8X/cobalt-precorrin-8 methylmutase